VNSVARDEDIGRDFRENIFTFYVTLFLLRITYNVAKRIFEATFDMLQVLKSRTWVKK